MKKTKLVLLTVLIVLVFYCGVVIFVTKPSTFAYEALFKGVDSSVSVPSSEKAAADAAAERAALMAEVENIASKYAEKAVSQAVEQAARNADAAIVEAVGNINTDAGSVDVSALVTMAVRSAMASARDEIIEAAAAKAVADIRAGEAAFSQEISQKVMANILAHEEEVVSRVTDEVIERISTGLQTAVEETLAAMPDEDYEKIRKEVRHEEISKLLNQLHD
jgi:subtilisin family serine protease